VDIDPSSPPVVKEFRFNRDSEIVTVVFGDDQSQDFKGSENYKKAHIAAAKEPLNKEPLVHRSGFY
jgi:hypothetical protein